MDLKDDKDVMQMLKHLSGRCKYISLYVDDGKRKGIDDGEGMGVVDDGKRKGGADASKKKRVDAGKKKREWDIAKKTTGRDGCVPMSGKNKSAKTTSKGNKEFEDQVDSESDRGYSYSEDEMDPDDYVETNDSLNDSELGSDDEEYLEARLNIREGKDVIDEYGEINVEGYKGKIEVEEIEEEALSDYVDSEGDVNSDSTDEEFDYVMKKKAKVLYDPKCDHKDLKLQLGMRFRDGIECKQALRTWAILGGHPIHFKRGGRSQLEAKCTPPCIWRCYGSIIKTECTFAIKVLVQPHTCPFSINNKLADYKWIARQYMNVLRVRPYMTVAELQIDINEKYNIQPSCGRLFRAKAKALELLRGTVKEHYGKLRSYIAELQRVDRDDRFELLVDDAVFKGLYIRFSALKKVIAKERAQARKGYGHMVCEGDREYIHTYVTWRWTVFSIMLQGLELPQQQALDFQLKKAMPNSISNRYDLVFWCETLIL